MSLLRVGVQDEDRHRLLNAAERGDERNLKRTQASASFAPLLNFNPNLLH